MKKVQFTREFYEHLDDAIMKGLDNVTYDDDISNYGDSFEVDGFEVEATICYTWELHDDSFDHAFGTWHDPYPYMEATGFESISDVHVYDSESEEEVEGFDYEAFMALYEKDTMRINYYDANGCYLHVCMKNGDRILYKGTEAVFRAYNCMNGLIRIEHDGKTKYAKTKDVKAA